MTSQSGGGGGIKGVTSNGQTPGGEIVAGAFQAGDATAALTPSLHHLIGATNLIDSPGNQMDFDDVLDVVQSSPLTQNNDTDALFVWRNGALNGFDYTEPAALVRDSTASAQPVLQVMKGSTVILEITTQESITGALASVTDANAKAVLTSIIAALTGIKVATNDTT